VTSQRCGDLATVAVATTLHCRLPPGVESLQLVVTSLSSMATSMTPFCDTDERWSRTAQKIILKNVTRNRIKSEFLTGLE